MYNPGIVDQSGPLLAQGLQSFGAGIGRGLESRGLRQQEQAEQEKRMVQNAKIAEQAMRVNPELLGEMSFEQFQSLSAVEKTAMFAGAVEGYVSKARSTAAKQQEEQLLAQTQARKSQADFNSRVFEGMQSPRQNIFRTHNSAGLPFLSESGSSVPFLDPDLARKYMESSPEPQRLPPEVLLQYAAEAGALRPGIDDLKPFLQGAQEPRYTVDPKTGKRHVTYGNQILPTGLDPAFGTPALDPLVESQVALNQARTAEVMGRTTPPIPTHTQARIEQLHSTLATLRNLKERGSKTVKVKDLEKLKLSENPWWGGEQIETVIRGFETELRSLQGEPPPPAIDDPEITARPATQEEFNRLPKGARFINPADGRLYIKK
jgi:hypothetical protein